MRFIREDIHDDIKPLPSPILHSFHSSLFGSLYSRHWARCWGFNQKPGDRASCSATAALARLEHPYHACASSRHKYLVVQVTLRTWAAPYKDTEFQFQKSKIRFRVLRFTVRHSSTFTSENPPLSLTSILISPVERPQLKCVLFQIVALIALFLLSSSPGTWDKSRSVPPSTRQTTWPLLNSVTWTHPQPSAVTSLSLEGENQINLYMETASIMVQQQRP